MSDIKIICDSLCDIGIEDVEKYDLEVVPITVIINDKEYKDGIDISKDDFYSMLREGDVYPKTSQATYGQFREVFEKYAKEGKQILYIAASSTATGTCQSAVMAKNDVDGDIHVFDSQQVCYGIATFIHLAAKMREEGKSVDEIMKAMEDMKDRVSVMFYVDTLEYLQKGGRISSTKAAIGNILNIKPILYIKDGLVSQLAQVRGKKNLVSKMIELVNSECGTDFSDQTIYIGYTDREEDRDKLAEAVRENLKPADIKFFKIGTGIVTHSGPGAAGIICLKNK